VGQYLLVATLIVATFPFVSPALADDTTTDAAKVAAGARIYENYCATCHGERLQSNSSVTFDLRRLTADDRPRFFNSVLNGKNAMPPWRGVLNMRQIESLWVYVQSGKQ
jgi:mono/diheme cytochrome c family protein